MNTNDLPSTAILADELGSIKAQQKDLGKREDAIKADLIDAAGNYIDAPVRFKGTAFEVLVSATSKSTFDREGCINLIAHQFGIDHAAVLECFEASTRRVDGYPVVRCTKV